MAKRRSRTNGAQRAFQIIECLVDLGRPATAYQIAKTLAAPLSTVYETINLLERLDILNRKSEDGKVSLGPRLYFYGLSYLRGLDADLIYRREADALCRDTGENVQVNVCDGDYMVVAAMCEGPDPYHITTRIGSRVPVTWTASGRFFLKDLSLGEIATIMTRAEQPITGRVHSDPVEFMRECKQAWEQGYFIQTAESDFAVSCIASPVVNPDGHCPATICLVVPEQKAREHGVDLAGRAMAAARNIEKSLGWRDGVENVQQILEAE